MGIALKFSKEQTIRLILKQVNAGLLLKVILFHIFHFKTMHYVNSLMHQIYFQYA